MGLRRMGPRFPDRRRGDDQTPHVGELHLGHQLVDANLPTIDPDHPAAAKELDVAIEDLPAGASRDGALIRVDPNVRPETSMMPGERGLIQTLTFVAVVAARVVEETATGAMLDAESVIDLTDQVRDDSLDWTAPKTGRWRLFTYWMHGTGQTAS